ncbi:MAG: DUF2723 domain-containing protein [Bacteroidetes bacterium]|nr:DUF2723 domain-containing protein [Bacteroidota bacterium]
MNFKRTNNITGWIVFLIASLVYMLTMEATGSLWDCGEFASSAYKLQIPHPPGAPLFVLIGRLFMMPFPPATAASGINLMSALASGFTILFLFWSITHFAKKLILKNEETLSDTNIIAIMAAGTVGALAFTFSDSFWYSAVEGEVYALSSFFTAIVFWAILKWEQNVTEEEAMGIKGHFTKADRWIILIFYLMGLSIGVHLLNLLTLPAIVLVYYFRRYNITRWGTVFAFIIGCLITGLVQKAVIQWSVNWASSMDVIFVNNFKLPFLSGFGFMFVIIAILIYFGLKAANKNNWNFLKLGLWSFAFMLLGYSSYLSTMIRSSSDPAIDMFNVDNPVSLVGYVSREQYGDWPILYGQDFTDQVQDAKITDTYIRSGNRYEKKGRKIEYIYAPSDKHFFPRMWDQSNDVGRADYYANFIGIGRDSDGNWERKPTVMENISFFFSYQLNWMYWRYFMWNFAGKQNDVQGVNMGNVRDGNWKTGIGFYDSMRLGDQSKMPDSMKENKANNKLYALPLILGILGLIYQAKKDKTDAIIVGLLFFFTGFAICIYLNQAGLQPRERDYAFVGSFYAFAFWIGLGVLFVREILLKYLKNLRNATVAASLLCLLLVPVLMGAVEWDDHDRSKKLLARDLAINYLESCAPNAILITFGDNDTYPLWYAQEVEGIRTDVRVINSSLLGTDWYINQLRYKINNSNAIDPIWNKEQIEGSTRDIIYYAPRRDQNTDAYMNLYTMMKDYAGSDDPSKMEQGRDGSYLNIYPSKKVFIPVDYSKVLKNGTVNANDSVVTEMKFEIPRNTLYKNDAAILNIIAANNWERPIYFTSPYGDLGFGQYLRQDGMTYRLVPVLNSEVNLDWAFDKMMNKFRFGNADKPGVYFDEENRRHLNGIRLAFAQVSSALSDANRMDEARKILEKCDKMMNSENFSYGMVSRNQQHNQVALQFLYAAYRAEDEALIKKVTSQLKKDILQQQLYYQSLSEVRRDNLSNEEARNEKLLEGINGLEQQFKAMKEFKNNESKKIKTDSINP